MALVLGLLISNAHAQNRDWVPLGQKSVGFRVDRDVINVGQSEAWFRNRSFRALHFVAERNDVHMMSIRIVYLNGHTEDLRVDRLMRPGSGLAVDLGGDRSYLRQIQMVYQSRPDFRGQAVIKVFGEPARRMGGPPGPGPGPARADWEELGCQDVNIVGADRDTVRVGRREGRFKAIRLHVRQADVEMLDLKVIYANGQPDDIRVRSLIRAGDRTRPLDLQGRERAIDRVEMVYRTAHNPVAIMQRGIRAAKVCVEGLQ